jgi:hypothetical protein
MKQSFRNIGKSGSGVKPSEGKEKVTFITTIVIMEMVQHYSD